MEQQDKGALRAWPEWLVQLGPGMDILLEAIDRHREELQRFCASSHVYRRLGQAQLQEFDALAEKQGLYGPSKQLKFDAVKRAPPPPALLRAAVYNVGQRHHTLKAYLYAKKVFLLKMLAEMPAAFQAGNLFGGFSAIRSVFECLGDMSRAAEALAGIKDASDAHWMGKRLDDAISTECASPIDWARMATAEFRKYEDLSSFRSDRIKGKDSAQDPMRGIRSISRHVRGLLPAYEVLIEFSQPRVGTLWLVYEESKTVPDRVKTLWNRNQLGVGFPRTVTDQMRPILVQLFDVLYDCLPFMRQLDRDFTEIDARMSKVTQDEVRTMLWHLPDLFDKHEDCPCGSGKRVKYCCGE
jgi:hypothetical protein